MPCTELILNDTIGEKLLFLSHDPILARITSSDFADTTAMWLDLWVKNVDNSSLNFSAFAQSKAGFTKVASLHQNSRSINLFLFDLSGILRSYVNSILPSGTGFIGTGGQMCAFYYEYGRYSEDNVKQAEQGESNVMYVARGVSKVLYDYVDTNLYTFYETVLFNRKFLTNNTNFWNFLLPVTEHNPAKKLTRKQKDFLYFIFAVGDCNPVDVDDVKLVLDYELTNGNAFQILKDVQISSGVKYMHTGIEKVKTYFGIPFDTSQIAKYRIGFLETSLDDLSFGMTYKLIDDDCNEAVTFIFENRLGGFETVVFRGQIDTSIERNHTEYERSFDYDANLSITRSLEAPIRDKQKLNSGWLRIEEFNWLKDLMTSVNVHVLNSDLSTLSVILKQVNYTRSSKEDLYMVEIEVSYEKEGYLTN